MEIFTSAKVTTMNFVPLLIQLISGAAGGNLAGSLFKSLGLGSIGNSIAGIVGGGIGGQFFEKLVGAENSDMPDSFIFLSSAVGGGLGGGLLTIIIGFLKGAIHRKP
jgi:uncharacterized membrane protein YeaQ/YmgE (transglycosylase-associated protein family)